MLMHLNGIQKTGAEYPIWSVGREAVIENRLVDIVQQGHMYHTKYVVDSYCYGVL